MDVGARLRSCTTDAGMVSMAVLRYITCRVIDSTTLTYCHRFAMEEGAVVSTGDPTPQEECPSFYEGEV